MLHAEFQKMATRHHLRLGNYTVIDWLLEMEPNSPPVIEYYRAWLQETDTNSRIKACVHIANRRGNASALLPDVWKLMDDPNVAVKRAALSTISEIEPKATDSVPMSPE